MDLGELLGELLADLVERIERLGERLREGEGLGDRLRGPHRELLRGCGEDEGVRGPHRELLRVGGEDEGVRGLAALAGLAGLADLEGLGERLAGLEGRTLFCFLKIVLTLDNFLLFPSGLPPPPHLFLNLEALFVLFLFNLLFLSLERGIYNN